MPNLGTFVRKPLKELSLARSMPKPLLIELREAGGHQPGRYELLLIRGDKRSIHVFSKGIFLMLKTDCQS